MLDGHVASQVSNRLGKNFETRHATPEEWRAQTVRGHVEGSTAQPITDLLAERLVAAHRENTMPTTVYQNGLMQPLLHWLAHIIYRCLGWKTAGSKPGFAKYVIIAAPHTSNWDFFHTVCLAFIYRLEPQMMMKADWFFWPLGSVLKWLGAIPIDRSKNNNVVAQSIMAFKRCDRMILVVPPSGTRKKVVHWRTGFYHIAHGAGVPVVLGFLDYFRKVGGFGPRLIPSGNIDLDMQTISKFYAGIIGKHPL